MHIPLLSNLLGLSGAQGHPQANAGAAASEPGVSAVDAGFAQLLASVPAQPVRTVQETAPVAAGGPVASAPQAGPDITAAPLPLAAQTALHAELATALNALPASALPAAPNQAAQKQASQKHAAPIQAAPAASHSGKILPPSGKLAAQPGKVLPDLPVTRLASAPSLHGETVDIAPDAAQSEAAPTGNAPAPTAPEPTAPAPFAFADLVLLRGWTSLSGNPAAPLSAPKTALANKPMPHAAAALTLPLAVPALKAQKDRAEQPVAASPVPPHFQPIAGPTAEPKTGPTSGSTSGPAEVRIPLAAKSHERLSPVVGVVEQVVQQAAAPAIESASPATETTANPPTAEQPAVPDIELAAVIDRLVLTRIQSREGRSEVNVPHPDFGRVTLSLSMAEQGQLGLSMPDAPAELRAAVGQAFAPPQRAETVAATTAANSDGSLASFADARTDTRTGDQRRDPNAAQTRSDQPRSDTATGRHHQTETPRDQRRSASGRGVLA